MTTNRGVTLLELMIAISITVVAIAATMGLVGGVQAIRGWCCSCLPVDSQAGESAEH